MLFLLLVLSVAVAIDIPRPGVNIVLKDEELQVAMYNKSYFKSVAIVTVYRKRNRKFQLQFMSLKPWTKKFWFDLGFYHFRNNQFHKFPMHVGLSMEEMFTKDYYGIGTTIKQCMGPKLPYPPNNYTITFVYVANATTFDVPMLGEYKFELAVKDGDSKAVVCTKRVIAVEDIKPKKCKTC